MKAQRILVLLVSAGLTAAAFVGCGGGSSSSTGSGGSATTSGKATSGVTTGQPVSTGTNAGTGGSTTTSMTTTTTGGPAAVTSGGTMGNVGQACMADADCGGGGLTCIKATDNNAVFGGGPANGYCSKVCTKSSDCPGATDQCLVGSSGMPPGVCVRGCIQGPAPTMNMPLDPNKCFGRPDVYCAALGNMQTVCLPNCGSDANCGALKCDPQAEVCVTTPHAGTPQGTSCMPSPATNTCAADCVTFQGAMGQPNPSMCAESCVFGGNPQDNCGGLKKGGGFCAYLGTGEGFGDQGFCAPVCAVQSDCDNTGGFWCFFEANLKAALCFGATPCPNGPSDCDVAPPNGDGGVPPGIACTQTKLGPFCLDKTIPLGSDSPDAGAGGAGGGGGAGGNDGGH